NLGNRLDTSKGTYIRDMVCDPPTTVRMHFTRNEYDQVLSAALRQEFFSLPIDLQPSSTGDACTRTPCSHWRLEIETNRRSNHVGGKDCSACRPGPAAERAISVTRVLDEIMRAKLQRVILPKLRCAYE